MDKILVVYTMKGCPWCELMKTQLKENKLNFYERDIAEYTNEYREFVKITNSEFIPAFLIIDNENKEPVNYFYVPDKHFETIEDGVKIIKEHFN